MPTASMFNAHTPVHGAPKRAGFVEGVCGALDGAHVVLVVHLHTCGAYSALAHVWRLQYTCAHVALVVHLCTCGASSALVHVW
eukprot:171997-Pelagomonas_calceolata.AAC.2